MALKEHNVDGDDIERGKVSEEPTSFVPKSGDYTCENVRVLIDTNPGIEYRDLMGFAEMGYVKEKRAKACSNKHPKPPRPPKGPLLNASDMELVRQISEIAALRRARIERLRALKKMKAVKGPSTSGNITAVVMTILFFVVIILQGVCSRGGVLDRFHGSPHETSVANKGLISMQFYSKPPANEINAPIYQYPNFRAAPSESGPWMEDGRGVN